MAQAFGPASPAKAVRHNDGHPVCTMIYRPRTDVGGGLGGDEVALEGFRENRLDNDLWLNSSNTLLDPVDI